MPLFALRALDRQPGGSAIRSATRDAHIEWLKSLGDKVRFAGALFASDGETMIGSLLVIEAADIDAMRALARTDPYAQAGLFESVEIYQTVWSLGWGRPDI